MSQFALVNENYMQSSYRAQRQKPSSSGGLGSGGQMQSTVIVVPVLEHSALVNGVLMVLRCASTFLY
jgi:hypothetical protein